MLIGEKIRKIRGLKGFSQDYLASKLQITQNAYSKMERGETKISDERLTQISNVLEIPKESIEQFSEKIFVNMANNKKSNENIRIETNEIIPKHYEIEVERLNQRITLLEQN
jgi:transcriptional regulator with XRE-family HTH domain